VSRTLDHIRVSDCMHHGILTCSADAPLGEVAGVMVGHHVHAVAITDREGDRPLGVVSDLDVVTAAAAGGEPTASAVAATKPLAVSAKESVHRAAQMMAEHSVTHLIVVDPASGHPTGVLSTLDIAAVYATG
jgi:CBS domain-containing protein